VRRRSSEAEPQVSSTKDAISVPSDNTAGISPKLCRLLGETIAGVSNDLPPLRERATNIP
jgi:hypothetical protein